MLSKTNAIQILLLGFTRGGIKLFLVFIFVVLYQLLSVQNDLKPTRKEEIPLSNKLSSREQPIKPVRYLHKTAAFQSLSPTKNNSFVKYQDDWRQVDANKEIFVYSAYYDTRLPDNPVVRINAIIRQGVEIRKCRLVYNDESSVEVSATSVSIKENRNLKYVSSFVLCDASTRGLSPVWVSLVKNGVILQPSLKIDDLTGRVHEGFLSVCVKPIHTDYNQAVWMVEFIELHQILGVEKFYFYNYSVGIDVENVLKYYIKSGVVTVLPWDLPVRSHYEIREEGMFSALNDCNLRNVGRYNYTIMIDLDEYIIPRNHSNYKEMLNDLGQHNSYIFKNAFYHLYWENDTEVIRELYSGTGIGNQMFGSYEVAPYLLTAYKTYRTKNLRKFRFRTKYIVDSKKALECGNHKVWQYTDANKALKVKEEVALMNHYRICEEPGFECVSRPRVIDRAAHKWLYPLLEKVAKTCYNVFSGDNLCPPTLDFGEPTVSIFSP